MEQAKQLKAVLNHIKATFVGKDEIINLLGISLVARENMFLLGPPGTAKSALVRALSNCISEGKNFEYLLTRFTEPNELFGPFDIRKLRDGELVTNTQGMMPEASMVFLDEIFNANSAILNSLLMALNEKVFRRGKEVLQLPALMFVGASNQLPEDESLNALLDRFLVRTKCDYVDPDDLGAVLTAGRKLEQNIAYVDAPTITPQEIVALQAQCRQVDMAPIQDTYIDVVHSLRNTGIKVSDRRAVKLLNLIGASAVLCDRNQAQLSDLWILRYIWDSEDQIEVLAGIVNNLLEKADTSEAHPQATQNAVQQPEDLLAEVQQLTQQWNDASLSFEEKNRVKDKLRYLQSRVDWIANAEQQTFIREQVDALWKQMLVAQE